MNEQTKIDWQWLRFEELSRDDLWALLRLRQEVFVVEQNCVYLDADNYDKVSWHLLGWSKDDKDRQLAAYLRVVDAFQKYPEVSIGRVVTAPFARRTGLGHQLMAQSLVKLEQSLGRLAIRISAQQHLEGFYSDFSFKRVSDSYLEDGIPHIEMLRS